jgi:hypothetical protein
MTRTMTAKRILEALLSAGDGSPRAGYVLRRVLPDSPLNLFLGRERPTGLPVLLLQVPENAVLQGLDGISTRAVHIDDSQLPDDPPGRKSIVVKLTEPALLDEYCLVLDQLIRGLRALRAPEDAVRMLAARLRAWLLLFSPDSSRMSEERQRGLTGELVVLKALATQSPGWAAALRAWTGPARQDRDFNFPDLVIEVKTNAVGGRDQVRVTNEYQLDTGLGTRLLLWVLSLTQDTGNGLTLPARVEEIRSTLAFDPGCLLLFEEKITAAGYSDLQFERVHPPLYEVASQRIYRVTEAFPRLIPTDLRRGVLNVSYAVDLVDCSGFLLDIRHVGQLLPPALPRQA